MLKEYRDPFIFKKHFPLIWASVIPTFMDKKKMIVLSMKLTSALEI